MSLDRESIEKVDEMVIEELLSDEEAKVVDIDKILNFCKSPIGLRLLSSNNVNREVPFVLNKKAAEVLDIQDCTENILIQGIIDCYFEEEGELVLIDYKTDYILEVTWKYGGQYRGQMALYKEALKRLEG